MILRDNKWDLPKGKLEPYENINDCAIREVKEECGVSNLQIVSELISTYHTYIVNSKSILKRTYWFKMQTNYNNKLTPQFNEGITKVEWVSKKNVAEKLTNSFGNIKDLLENNY